jgi:hypothetical protein
MAAATGPYDSLPTELAIPHRVRTAYRQLLKGGLDVLPAIRRGAACRCPVVVLPYLDHGRIPA